jgi:3-polyprenyl-4-hydroxybenzoate decarboxylase
VLAFFRHLLERVDWQRDLHFHTRTTIDTLDYSGTPLIEDPAVKARVDALFAQGGPLAGIE